MFSGITFDTQEVVDIGISLITPFMPFVYIIGGITIFALVMFVVIGLAKKASN